jgi:hypothetical protein
VELKLVVEMKTRSYVEFLVHTTAISVESVGILGFEKKAMGILVYGP